MANTCTTTVNYWIGTTQDRFTISDSLINESTNLSTYTTNNGTLVGGDQLDFVWITNNFSIVNKFVFKGAISHTIYTKQDDVHALVIIPEELSAINFSEVVLGTNASLTEGLHYNIFTIENNGKTYKVYYLRDLTGFKFQKRIFTFDLIIA